MADIPLKALGLERAWPKLARLQDEVQDLGRQVEQANAEVRRLESALAHARGEDVAAEARALRKGKEPPKTSKEGKVQRELETARRNAAVLQRAVEDAQSDLLSHRAKHGAALFTAVVEARNEIARGFAAHARAAADGFGRWSEIFYVLKDLAPPPQHDENAPAVRSSMSVIGIHTTQSSGPQRGEVESMLAYLASLAPSEAEEGAEDAA